MFSKSSECTALAPFSVIHIYTIKRAVRMTASALDISLSNTRAPIITEAATAKTRSFLTVCLITHIGATIAATPTMSIALNTLLPTTLPTAISAVPLRAETKLTQNSGIDVPRATMVRPITI